MELTHFNDEGRARMVDVTEKPQTIRIARAAATVNMRAETMQMLRSGGMKKGDVLAVAQVLKPPEGLQGRCRLHKNAVAQYPGGVFAG